MVSIKEAKKGEEMIVEKIKVDTNAIVKITEDVIDDLIKDAIMEGRSRVENSTGLTLGSVSFALARYYKKVNHEEKALLYSETIPAVTGYMLELLVNEVLPLYAIEGYKVSFDNNTSSFKIEWAEY